MKKLLFNIFTLLTLSLTGNAQKEGLNSINKSDLKAYMTFFASDEMEGRETGTHGNDAAALYLKTNLMRLGLKPVPGTEEYYQIVPLISSEIKNKETYLKVNNSFGETLFTTDSLVYLSPVEKTMDVTGSIVFAGYGYEDEKNGYNDLKDIDLKDKIVLIMTGNPKLSASGHVNSLFDQNLEKQKLTSIFSKEPKAILYVYDPMNKFPDAYASGLADITAGKVGTKKILLKNEEESSIPFQVIFITQNTANMLLKTSGHNLQQLQEKIITEGKPVSFEIKNIKSSIRTSVETIDIVSQNVIGMIEGSDPILKSECVIYTAHFDHEGINDNKEIYNGADDNASGSMAMLEIAQAFMNLKKKPLRTIVFAWVNGEEKGLLGSLYYADNPVIPLEKTLLDINLDMIGRSWMPSDTGNFMGYDLTITKPGEILVYSSYNSSKFLNILNSSAKETGVKVTNKGKDLEFGGSDYVSFMEKGVPALFFNSGIHSDLHSIRDDVEKIDFEKMEKVSKMAFLLGYNVANQKERAKADNLK